MKKHFLALGALLLTLGQAAWASNGKPDAIQQGNILHCFNWPVNDVKNALQSISDAGFGAVQLSPLQRPDVKSGSPWHDLYRPYDLAFKPSGMCSESELQSLCTEAEKYGIKVIVDVVANHVDKTAGYHDTWWDSNGRVRWEGGINYGDRRSITHGQLGDYGDVNSELSEVAARGKAYVQKLASLGVKGIRWDAAKHIGLPSEGCQFWAEVTSVPGVWHYGEILDKPGPNASIITEYAKYMSVTDNEYCNYAARDNGGIPGGYGGSWAVDYKIGNKCVYWAESHDTYSNDDWSCNRDQATIDRAYAAYACRNDATALYLSRPNAKGFNNIKVGKGSTAFTAKHIAEVNKFRNAMVGKADYFTGTSNACSITRQNGGAVIVMKGSGNISIANGGGYCPAGTYTDRVSGGTFTVTASTISGNVGSSGIAVIYNGGDNPGPNPDPDPDPDPSASLWILGNLTNGGWSTTPGTGVAMAKNGNVYTAKGVSFTAAANETKCYFNITDYVGSTWDDLNMKANRYGAAAEGDPITIGTPATIVKFTNNVDASKCYSWTIPAGSYDISADLSTMKITVVKAGDNPNPDPDPIPGTLTITGDYNIAYSGDKTHIYYWGATSPIQWNDAPAMATAKGSDGKTYKVYKLPAGMTNVIFKTASGGKTGDLDYKAGFVHDDNGPTSTAVVFKNGDNPNPNPDPNPDGFTIYYDNSVTNWSNVNIHYWNTPNTSWPGTAMTKVKDNVWQYTFTADPSGLTGFLFCDGSGSGDNNQTADYLKAPVKNHIYKGAGGNKGAVSDEGEYRDAPTPTKPVVKATPGSSTFSESVTVKLTATPAGSTIYYTDNGQNPTTSSTKYVTDFTLTATTTIKAMAVGADGTQGDVATFTYTKSSNPGPDPVPGNNLITDYYKVNPNGQYGSQKTINVSGHPATRALSNWKPEDLIAQGVARDVCQAFRGTHERPVIDSYALYAAYDNQNLYLGVQFVYTVWDAGGEGKQPGESKPYNSGMHLVLAFDLDPAKSFDGYIGGTGPIWNETQKGAKFNNGVDHVMMLSTKPGDNNFTWFKPTPDGHASYDPEYCIAKPEGVQYGYADGLLPSIDHIWGQAEFGYDPELLKGNAGFVDLKGEVAESAHTFYEFKIPLSLLGCTDDYIRTNGIGVMFIDKYGTSPVGGTPYDPSYFDDPFSEYSYGDNTSAEKEDEDIITYKPARIGKASSAVEEIFTENADADAPVEYFNIQGMRVANPAAGVYIKKQGNKVSKVYIR